MDHDQLPALFRSADDLSLSAQNKFFAVLLAHLVCLVIAAYLSVLNSPTRHAAVWQALALLVTLACSIYLAASRPDRMWYAARALAESIKTLSWRFVSRAEPFDAAEPLARAEFRNRLRAALSQNKDVAQKLTQHLDLSQVSEAMAQMRAADLGDRLKVYTEKRVNEQLAWYAHKARSNSTAASVFFALLISVNVIAIVLALTKIQFPTDSYWPTDVFIAASACLLTWMQAKRFTELSAAYALTAHEINFVREQAATVTTESAFSAFVGDAENAFSREHTQWEARRDV